MHFYNILKVFCLVLITKSEANEINKDQNKSEISVGESRVVKLEESQRLKNDKFARQSISLWPNIEQDQDLLLLEQFLIDIEGRGKSHRYKKLTKFMYPLFMGVLVAKIILIPLILKMLTAISASAMIMSKIAFITTGFVALKWILSDKVYDTKDRFEFIYLPTSSNGKPYRSASGGFSLWDDQSLSDSSSQYVAVAPANAVQQQKYIPVTLKHETPYTTYRGTSNGGTSSSTVGLGNSIKDLYYYSQHNYNNKNNNNDGKPFL